VRLALKRNAAWMGCKAKEETEIDNRETGLDCETAT
jgi:hypothetical protein